AAADLVAIASPDAALPALAVQHALTSAGVVDARVWAHAVRARDPEAVISAIGTVAGAHIGLAETDDVVVAVVTVPSLVVSPFPRRARGTGGFTIDAKLLAPYRRVEIDLVWDDESRRQVLPSVSDRAFTATLGCQNRSGQARVVIVGLHDAESVLLARF